MQAKTQDDVEALLQQGWGYHDSNSTGLAAQLEAIDLTVIESRQAGALLKLSNHTMGEHLNDWPRACVLARQVWQQVDGAQSHLEVAIAVYVAELVSGDSIAAANAELAALATLGQVDLADPTAVIGVSLQCKVTLAAALVGSGSLEQGAQLYAQVIQLAQKVGDELSCDRMLAVASNNLTGELLAIEPRSVEQGDLMLVSANAALNFWRRCGTWLNEARALYLLQNVHNELEAYQVAFNCGEQALSILSTQGQKSEPIDEAFVLLTLAASQEKLGLSEQVVASLAQADALAAAWDEVSDASLLTSFAEERGKVGSKGTRIDPA